VLVNLHGEYSWHANPPTREDEHSATFTAGSGEIVELRQPVSDPEEFARDLRRLIGPERSALSLWNSLTTLVTAYRKEPTGETILNVVNYADVPDNVQVQVRGRFAAVELESPEEGCCLPLRSFVHGGFTEFTIPRLVVTARIHLKTTGVGLARP
jgi:hypothetical protein